MANYANEGKVMKMTKEQIETFLDRLYGPEGCNFHYEGERKAENFRWKCNSSDPTKPLSRAILQAMNVPQDAVDEFLDWCDRHGGHCDCEIIWNCVENLEDQGIIDRAEEKEEDTLDLRIPWEDNSSKGGLIYGVPMPPDKEKV